MRCRKVYCGALRLSSVLTGYGQGGQDGGPPFVNRQGGRNSGKNSVFLVLKTMEGSPRGNRRVVPTGQTWRCSRQLKPESKPVVKTDGWGWDVG
jgi:hypothetical protein